MTTIGRLRASLFRCLSFLSAALLCLRRICVFFFFSFCLLTHRHRRTRDPLLSCFAMYIAVRARARVCTYACLCAYFLPPYGKPSPPGAGCFTGTIWQEQSRPGDSARVTASPRSTFPLKDAPRHRDGGFNSGNRHDRTERMKAGESRGADHFQIP